LFEFNLAIFNIAGRKRRAKDGFPILPTTLIEWIYTGAEFSSYLSKLSGENFFLMKIGKE
jgi:hypothetical protein